MQNNAIFKISTNILLVFMMLNVLACKQSHQKQSSYNITKSNISDSAMVVTAHPLATKIGLEILQKGGNAVDAAIAVQFALAVCYPQAGNIGGGGFMLFRTVEGQISCLDFREKAPSAAFETMYLDAQGQIIKDKSVYGPMAAGVPGTVDGMFEAFQKFSKLKNWPLLVQPAIELASQGFFITEQEAQNLRENQHNFKKYNLHQTAFHKSNWMAGDRLAQQALAETLKAIRDKGRAGFYEGSVAQKIVQEMQAGNGIITTDDLVRYKSVWREPLAGFYRGHKIWTVPPPSSGGIALIQLLKMVEPYDMSTLKFQSAAAVHLMVEAERLVYADRAHFLGDPDYYPVPQSQLLDSMYIAKRMSGFNPRQADKSENIGHGAFESEETTHFSIVDAEGNAVSVTTTINGSYGAFTVVQGAGFILNNEMDDFSVKSGAPNMYGLVGAEANKIEANKRMLSSMTPTIIEKDKRLYMVVGTPGGSTIITSVFQTIVNVIDFNMQVDAAVVAPRFHHQWLPDHISIESQAIENQERKILQAIGHELKERSPIGRVEAIVVLPDGRLHGAADPRGDDDTKGY